MAEEQWLGWVPHRLHESLRKNGIDEHSGAREQVLASPPLSATLACVIGAFSLDSSLSSSVKSGLTQITNKSASCRSLLI